MGLSVAEIRAKIASGELKPNRGGGGVGAGTFGVRVDSAEFAAGENGNLRGKVVCVVIDAQDPANIGKKFNLFYQTVNSGYLESSIAELSAHCASWGISEERIYDRAETAEDILGNMMVEINRLAVKGLLLGVVERKDSGKVGTKGKPMFWSDWVSVELAKAGQAPAAASAAPAAASAAPAAAPASAPAAAPAKKKPWQK